MAIRTAQHIRIEAKELEKPFAPLPAAVLKETVEDLQRLQRQVSDVIRQLWQAQGALYRRMRELYQSGWTIEQLSNALEWSYAEASLFLGEYRALRQKQQTDGEDTVVYFIADETGEKVKIGITEDVQQRLRSLQMSSPTPLRLSGTIRGGRRVEAELHERFARIRLHGEWFKLTPELDKYIQAHAERVSSLSVPSDRS